MSIFKPSEVFQFAIRIEENGETFYRTMASKLKDPAIQDLFTALADEEVKHKKTYEGMVSNIEKYEPFETFPGEYFEYLRAYANNHIFAQDVLQKEMNKIHDPAAALQFAIQRELDSILYYQEVKNLVPENQRNVIDKIIDEERKHYMKLSGCKLSGDAACVRE
jgi:rubrerythrin